MKNQKNNQKEEMKGRSTKRVASYTSEEEDKISRLRKGPWKAEEDEVLLKHVRQYNPGDWSSLLSKRLLQRTGKSCRLGWVDKLQPNLKNWCKFSGEEESLVVELQAQFGNKWAKIATFLSGRTDNDVKNFWNSRQNRLSRVLHNDKHHKRTTLVQGSEPDHPGAESCSIQRVVPLNVSQLPPNGSCSSTTKGLIYLDQQDLPYWGTSNACEEVIGNLDLDFMGAFPGDNEELIKLSGEMASYFEPLQEATDDLLFDENALRFFDDLPSDMFDQMDPLPSPPSKF